MKCLKSLSVFAFYLLFSISSFGQETVNQDNNFVTDKLLKGLNAERENFQHEIVTKISNIDSVLLGLDRAIQNSESHTEIIYTLKQRVKILEEKQDALEKKTFGAYKYNYSSAIVNLASMEREIKPLELFNSSRAFFSTLESVSNPTNYAGYSEWFETFKRYIAKKQEKEASLQALNHLLLITGDLSKGTPFTGPLAGSLFEGISSFINSLRKKDGDLKDQSLKMFKLTATISQFTHDKNLIETEWDAINKSLDKLKKLQEEAILENIVEILDVRKDVFDEKFTNETDAIKRFEFIKELTTVVESKLQQEKLKNPDKWKDKYFQQLKAVQTLKIQFGGITFRILENIKKYEGLIQKYREDEYLGGKVIVLESKLITLKEIFESTFNPQEYILIAENMYVVD
jgi:hypothetical protein